MRKKNVRIMETEVDKVCGEVKRKDEVSCDLKDKNVSKELKGKSRYGVKFDYETLFFPFLSKFRSMTSERWKSR